MAFARKVDNPEHRCSIRTTPDGVEAVEWYLVDTDDIRSVLLAPGLPAEDDPLDPVNYPDVLCYGLTAEEKVGAENVSEGRVGWTYVRADYATPGAGNFTQPNLYPGQKWTEIQPGERTEQLYETIDPGDPRPPPPINNGDGYAREVGLVVLLIYRCYDLTFQPDFARLNTLAKDRAFNDASITVPKLFGAGASWSIAADKAQYKGYEAYVQGKVLIVRHSVQVGLVPRIEWPFRDDAGKSTGGVGSARVYPKSSFANLW